MKLLNITSDYKSFADNQLLTAAQLNLLIHYLDNQDRLSRLALTGAGIICGLELTQTKSTLTIGQGTALTTDGDLIKLKNKNASPNNSPISISAKTFSSYIPFSNHKVMYPHFLQSEEEYIPILELLNTEEAKNFTEAKSLEGIQINDFVVVLYLENYTKPYDVCNGSDCDSQGIPEISNLRYFLIRREYVEKVIVPKDSIYRQFQKIKQLDTEDLKVDRVLAASLIAGNSVDLEKYNTTVSDFRNEFNLNCRLLFGILEKDLNFTLPTALRNQNVFVPKHQPNAQYNYDFLLDLVATFNEIRKSTSQIDAICNHDLHAFPKHIMLGTINDPTFRHGFYKSSALANDSQVRAKITSLLRRFETILNAYTTNYGIEVQIRPSVVCGSLGKKAIPSYYGNNKAVFTNWKFGLDYLGQSKLNTEDSLRRDLSCKDFFRIEGVYDKNWATALDTVLKKRKAYGLNFDVICLGTEMSLEEIKLENYPAFFNDLQTHLTAWKAQQSCLFETAITFLSGFSTKENGGHNHIKDYFVKDFGILDVYAAPSAKTVFGIMESASKPAEEVKTERIATETKVSEPIYYNYSTRKIDQIEEVQYYKEPIKHYPITNGAEDIGLAFLDFNTIEAKYSYNDYLAYFDKGIIKAIPDLVNWESTDKKMRVTYPTQLIAAIRALLNQVPSDLDNINDAQLKSYDSALNNLCQLVNTAFNFINDTINDPKNKYEKQDFEDHYLAILNRLKDNCCAGDFLRVIFQETLIRKANILKETMFGNFVNRHPGMVHMAGVPNGGTFLIVYNGRNNKVIADFALPYMCCSKNAPIAFMITPPVEEEEEVVFDIAPEICKNAREELNVPFEISPEGVKVALTRKIEGLAIKRNILHIDPSFSEFDTLIQFQANGVLLEKSTTIRQKHALSLSHEFDSENGVHQVNSNIKTREFQWYIDGKEFEGESSDLLTIKNSFKNEIIVSLSVKTPCGEDKAQISINPNVEEEPVSFSIEPTHCKDEKVADSVPFELSPKEASIKLAKSYPGLSIKDHQLVISSAFGIYDEPIEFIINGEISGQKIIIRKNEVLELNHKYDQENSLHIITSNISSKEFEWYLNERKITSKTSDELLLSDIKEGSNMVVLSLQTPCGKITGEIEFEHKGREESDCASKSLESLKESKAKIAKLLSRSKIADEIQNDLGFFQQVVNAFEEDPDSFISGQKLGELDMVRYTFEGLFSKILGSENQEDINLLIEVYRICLEMLYAMIICIDGRVFEELPWILSSLFGTIERHIRDPRFIKNLQGFEGLLDELIAYRIKNGANEKEDIIIIHFMNIMSILKQQR
ncbi:hypothetical protein ACFSKL_15040 [Belliella marina]|uniref:Uncharacterized protein n=1 Tax=Belliella marina TaxID=1644146 RepID=A0ABW4VR23_9BACT